MAVLSSKALHEQLSIIMGALTKAAVVEICEVVDEGYAVLQMEITRSHKENEDLKKKLHLIESIVVRGGSAGKDPGVAAAAESAQQQPETQQQQWDNDGGDTAAAPGGDGGADVTVAVREEVNMSASIHTYTSTSTSELTHSFTAGRLIDHLDMTY